MRNAIEVNQTSISYSLSSHNHIIFAKTSLASQVDRSPKQNELPGEYGKFLTLNSINWLLEENIPMGRLALASQVHGSDIMYVNSPSVYQNIDGFYTDCPEIYLTIRTADCAAVFVSVPEIPAVGIAHVGWRGARLNIVGNLIEQIMKRWSVDPVLFRIAVSPHIRNCCYSVGNEFNEYFQTQYLQRHNNQLHLDLEKVIIDQLETSGIDRENLSVSADCTSCSNLPLYSYRAQQKTSNRLLSIICIQHQK